MPTNPRSEAVGANVRAELARRKASQTDLAAHLRISQSGVSARLLGRVAFNVDELFITAAFLGVPVAVLLDTSATADALPDGRATAGAA